ncbi:M15 family metallopeptidase [Paenibacillus radicis (ex Xue et al. 2023)]|uniref:D-alanyl-D-alanine carboxypeptidase family protein n=1 Tax=Paenibacillus radicis (ex Xue et al. 2023) TaxID=2972489 RepID=A0ABT1YHS3_9BACL|nr:D-alanyl-D-alanine carboxypeptidase family protein [Paenibacillus radicis (ex Xue et al. 2023)]MCR8632517.1 D-alanyl-D-alanine carboxypeptidase family protein [Paenibacillus radicis (ex Xue et al. 2023)]
MKLFASLKPAAVLLLAGILIISAAGCGNDSKAPPSGTGTGDSNAPKTAADPAKTSGAAQPVQTDSPAKAGSPAAPSPGAADPAKPSTQPITSSPKPADTGGKGQAVQVAANPADKTVLVNKAYKLPDSYVPQDLVDPNVPFIFKEKTEKRKLRKEAAAALEKLFKAASDDKLPLSGVSAYRSHETQKTVYANYVKKDGEEAANKYSAKPGHSEHETGLAIDVAGISGKCAASDCFAATKEAKWLDENAAEFGFIIRYPKGKESITGYQYEPWHLRYVGTEMSKEIAKRGVTMEEYLGQAVPVNKQ